MRSEDIQPGVMLVIPRGGDITRKQPYCLKITEVRLRSADTGYVHVQGERYRLTGAPSRHARYRRRPGPPTIAAVLNPARIQSVIAPRPTRGDQP